MKLDITSLLSGKVKSLQFSFELELNGENAPMPPVGVTVTSPVRVTGVITDSGTCLSLRLDAEADYSAMCDRCAESLSGVVSTHTERMVVEEGSLSDNSDEEYFIACDGMLDLDDDIAEELMLAFPSRMICSEDCRGVCPVCGQNLNLGDCGCAAREAERVDPRWASLAKLLSEQKEEK